MGSINTDFPLDPIMLIKYAAVKHTQRSDWQVVMHMYFLSLSCVAHESAHGGDSKRPV